jgi:hypothetical protein
MALYKGQLLAALFTFFAVAYGQEVSLSLNLSLIFLT